ncbi:MAG: exosortase system-associated protein, TIGR04073 family [Nitrosomonas sp.]|nr:MAG: exosortase system-associated protein, TIGR04073 family [Nitrosomonas sp.]
MKTITQLIVILSLFALCMPHASAREQVTTDVYFSRAGVKLLSGVANVATGWLELPKNIALMTQKDNNILIGLPDGLLWGLYHTAGRTGNGVLDFATFWLPTYPSPDPVFVWEDFSRQTKYLGWRMAR